MTADFYTKNRHALVEATGHSIIVLSAYTSMQRSNDMASMFEQEANFWYLTGVEEPDWRLIIDGSRNKAWLVMPDIDETHRTFDGGLAPDQARVISGVDAVIDRAEAESLLIDLAKKHTLVYSLGEHPHREYFSFTVNPAEGSLWRELDRTFHTVRDCRAILARLRAIKQPEEIKAIKRAVKHTVQAFEAAKHTLDQLSWEYELEAEFTYAFRRNGVGHAYDPIVAGGKNACTLHYLKNDQRLRKGQLVLLDIGAKADGYSADISRTFSVGTPTARQREVHEAVQRAHRQIIKLLKPGLLVRDYMNRVDTIMKQSLREIGLIDSDDGEAYRTYFPHAISHGLGIDTHDSLGGAKELEPGMVLTVEPGIYIPEEGIGVRIEDDILITQTGHSNLSARLSTDLV